MPYSLYPLKLFVKKKLISIPIILGLLLNAAGWLSMFWGVTARSEQAVTHYTILFQVDQLGSFRSLYWVPATGTIVLLLNLILGWLLYSYDVFLAELLVYGGVILQGGILVAVSILTFLNA